MFRNLGEQAGVTRGDFLSLFTRGERFFRYLRCILIGLRPGSCGDPHHVRAEFARRSA